MFDQSLWIGIVVHPVWVYHCNASINTWHVYWQRLQNVLGNRRNKIYHPDFLKQCSSTYSKLKFDFSIMIFSQQLRILPSRSWRLAPPSQPNMVQYLQQRHTKLHQIENLEWSFERFYLVFGIPLTYSNHVRVGPENIQVWKIMIKSNLFWICQHFL